MANSRTELKKAQDIWYKKLKDSGFDDIEYKDGSIRIGYPRPAGYKDPTANLAVREYYYMAYHFLNDYKFETNIDKIIWEYHANGLSVRNISKLLKDAKVATLEKTAVWTKIQRLDAIMKAKYLAP